ncbi:MG2 domain-containing protein [Pedobacter panaciterrae]|uniref:alpha-2-macroglobulin family protein n=1 Tax=Pedobacter panaciterrae TaxID=363849 RepID=UPI002599CC5E|nr:MG2 domain-containing protein [uncultured Pedobacter sp.]
MRLILACILFAFFNASTAFAQTDLNDEWTNIENSIRTRTQLEETLKTVNSKKEESIRINNDIALARCLYYAMLIKDLKTEDSLYFRNSSFIDSLLINKKSSTLLKTAMHLMQARRVLFFAHKHLKFRPSTYETKNLQPNYGAMNLLQRDSIVRFHFKEALRLSGSAIPGKSIDISWLSSNADKLLFKADLADIALTERIGFETGKTTDLNLSDQDIQTLIVSEPKGFQQALQSSLDTAKIHSHLMDTYTLWMRKHNSKPEELQYIQMLIKYYFYSRMPNILSNAWTTYLKKNLSSPLNTIQATATFYLFQYQYYKGIKYGLKFEAQYKGYLRQAVQLYEQHQSVVNEFSAYKKTLETLLKKIKNQEINVQVTDRQMTEAPIMLTARYRGIQKIYYRIVKIGIKEKFPNLKTERIEVLLNRPAIRDSSFLLPAGTDDFDKHALYLKLESLPVGTYNVIFSPSEIKTAANLSHMEYIHFQVSDLAVVNTGDHFIVLNRKTGFPISGVKVVATEQVSTNLKGFTSIKKTYTSKEFMFVSGKDTLMHDFNRPKRNLPREIYNTEAYDDLEEFYDAQTKLQIYTDRGIYRPGQRVQYKVIMLTRDPSTGQNIVFSKANKYFKSWMADNEPLLELKDPNYRTVDSIKLVPDDYGSFSGSFVIPKNAMTGQWSIDGDVIDGDNGYFKVEEYKRPTMEITMEKPAEGPLPGEPFELKLKVKSLSGADLNRVKITYQIIRESNYFGNAPYINPIVTDTIGYTDEKGLLVIKVNDVNLPKKNPDPDKEWAITYRLSATATEATGETTSQDNTFSVSSWPVKINIPAVDQYDRKGLPKLNINAKTENSKFKPKEIHISIFQNIIVPDTTRSEIVDQWQYTKDQLKVWFPNEEILNRTSLEKKSIFEKTIPIDSTIQFQLDKTLLQAGKYELAVTTTQSEKTSGHASINFDVFDTEQSATPGNLEDFNYLSINTAKPGDKIDYYTATIDSAYVVYGLTYYVRQKQSIAVKTTYHTQYQGKGMQAYTFTVPKDALESLVLTKAYVLNNKLYINDQNVYLAPPTSAKPEIIIEKYRKVLAPGTKETFTVSVKTAKENIAAQLMTGMYDAALDKLASHQWNIPNNPYFSGYLYGGWSQTINNSRPYYHYWPGNNEYNNQSEFINEYEGDIMLQQLRGRVPGLAVPSASFLSLEDGQLNEVVVRGYNTADVVRYATTGSAIYIRGTNSLVQNAQPLIIVDGVPFSGSLNDFNAASITEAMVLKGADATAIYGSKAANGVLIISTKGKIILPGTPEPQPMVRKDFSETAFFYPKLYADKNGLYTFNFTMPQTATAWNWKLMAHTKSGLFAYAERKLNTRLDLMVQPNMPRLLYQGDEIVLNSRISNLDSAAMDVKLSCKIEDAVTGEDLTAKVLKEPAFKIVKVAGKLTETAGFAFKVPEGQLNPLTIVTTVNGGALADAEEHTLPILPKKVFMRKQVPLVFSKKDSLVQAPKLPDDADLYGLSLYADAKPQAALINSLPFLANYSFNCSEQVFNKLYARVTANQLMRNQPELAKSFKMRSPDAISDTTERKLPDELAEAAMPWLNLANQTAKQQKQLYQVLDTISNRSIISDHLNKLYSMQDFYGALPWFEGGKSNSWISNYVLRGFGKLNQQGWQANDYQRHSIFIKRLITYTDSLYATNGTDGNLFGAYSRSFWKNEYPLNPGVIKKINTTLELAEKDINNKRLYDQALWIIVSLKYTTPDHQVYKKALAQLSNIQQRAINDDLNGMRWKEISDGDDLSHSKEETIAMLYEAFTQAGQNTKIADGLSKWMLSAKQDYSWRTTTGTAAAIDMLKESATIKTSFVPDSVSAQVGNQQMNSSNGLLAGQRNQFISLNKVSPVTVSANNTVSGGITWHYFSAEAQADDANNKVKLKKTLFNYDQQKNAWVPLSDKPVLKIGEKIKIVLTVETAVSLRFVQLEDKRAGVFEPLDGSSGQQYQDGTYYYRSVRDAGQQLFIDLLPSGRTEFSYEVTVTQEGTFKNGAAMLQCLYNPGVTAYSNAMTIISKP